MSLVEVGLSSADVALLLAYERELHLTMTVSGEQLAALWDALPSARDEMLSRWAADAGPVVDAARAEGADLASGMLSGLTGENAAGDLVFAEARLTDPFLRTWHDLSSGMSFADAKAGGRSQADALGHQAVHDGARARLSSSRSTRVVGFRRVPEPSACEWCQVVATQRYHSADTATFGHDFCKCTVVPVLADRDPGRVIANERLAQLSGSGAVARVSAARARSRA